MPSDGDIFDALTADTPEGDEFAEAMRENTGILMFEWECPECEEGVYQCIPEQGDTLACEHCGYDSAPVEHVEVVEDDDDIWWRSE